MKIEKKDFKQVHFFDIEDDSRFVKIEKSLIEFGYFSIPKYRDGKKNPKQEKLVKILDFADHGLNAQAEILTHRRYGLPTTADLTKYLAFLKIVQERHFFGKKIVNPIEFTHYELLKKAGVQPNQTRYEEVTDWLRRMHNTQIILHGELADQSEEREKMVHVFENIIIAGSPTAGGEKEKRNKVYLSDWAIKNISELPLIPIDFDTYHKLKNDAAKLLVIHLQVWLYGSKDSHMFQKKYPQFCQILGYTEQSNEADIYKQLKKAFLELLKHEYISSWKIAKATNGYKIMLWHGKKFHRDLKQVAFLVKPPPTDLPLLLPSNEKMPKTQLSDQQTETFNYLQSFSMFADLAYKLIKKFEISVLKRRTAWAIEILDEIDKRTKVANKGGFLYKVINSDDIVPDSFQTPEEKKIAGEVADELREKEEKEQARQSALETAYLNFRKLKIRELFDILSPEDQINLKSTVWKDIKKSHPNFGVNFDETMQDEEMLRMALWHLEKTNSAIISQTEFLELDTEDNLIKNYNPDAPRVIYAK